MFLYSVSMCNFCLFVISQPGEGVFLEWKAEEVISLDGPSDQDWAMISSVGYKPDRDESSDRDSGKNGLRAQLSQSCLLYVCYSSVRPLFCLVYRS